MPLILEMLIIILVVVMLAVLIWLVILSKEKNAAQTILTAQLEAIKLTQDNTKDTIQKSLASSQNSMNQNLQQSAKILNQLHGQIGGLQQSSKSMTQVAGEVRKLQDVFKNPKHRGILGEKSLQNILSQLFPKNCYQMQYSFKNGKIADAIVKLTDNMVAIDAKFPLPAFERILQAENEQDRIVQRKQFSRDVLKHVTKIASDYIRPQDGTVDFAIMYIPAENVYYETIVQSAEDDKDIAAIALEKKVVPVSPNLLYTYLMTIVMGLEGAQIEKKAGEILKNLKKLDTGFAGFTGSWDVLGRHLRNAASQYDEGDRKLMRFRDNLIQIQNEDTQNEES